MTPSLGSGPLAGALRSPLVRLLERGDIVEVLQGKLIIAAKSGKPIPAHWLNENRENMLADIAVAVGVNAFIYHDYSLGQYGPHKHETLTLRFTNLRDSSDAFAAFNVSLKRQREGRNKQPKGSPLPKGEFSPPKAGEFVKLWKRTGLKQYNAARLCRYMGNLKGFAYSASYSAGGDHPNKMANKSIDLLNVSYAKLVASMPSRCLSHALDMPKPCLRAMPKDSAQTHINQGLGANSSTGDVDHGLRLQGSAVNGLSYSQITDNTISTEAEEWLREYEAADGLSPI